MTEVKKNLYKQLADLNPRVLPAGTSTIDFMIGHCVENDLDAMATVNVSVLREQVELWRSAMPSVDPHYAIKCNPHPVIARALHNLGCSFDCASPAEVQRALSVGALPSQIIYANPQKQAHNIKQAYELGVATFTFDSEAELVKMVQCTPAGIRGQFVLRIIPPLNTGAHQNFGSKFGATRMECERLIKLAAKLQKEGAVFDLAGFSFHVGTGCPQAEAYRKTIEECCRLCKLAQALGFKPYLLDIGGGFITPKALLHLKDHEQLPPITFQQIGKVVEEAVADAKLIFGENMKAIAEPGRFFASDCVQLVTRIYGRRVLFDYDITDEPKEAEDIIAADKQKRIDRNKESDDELTESSMMDNHKKIEQVKYYVGEGMYGFFNNIMFDHALPNMKFFRGEEMLDLENQEQHLSFIFGPTCDSMDVILDGKQLPMLEIGDFIVVEGFGAYTWAAATEFNGIAVTQMVTVINQEDAE